MENLSRTDPEVAEAIRNETERQGRQLEMIASENFVSEAVLEALGTDVAEGPDPFADPATRRAILAARPVRTPRAAREHALATTPDTRP